MRFKAFMGAQGRALWAQFAEASIRVGRADLLVYALLVSLGILQGFFSTRAADFLGDDVFWVDAGRSLIEHGSYGINGYTETNMPPGLPALLGIIGTIWGYSPAVFLHAIDAFATLAFLVSYELLRRQAPRIVAASICLLLMTSLTHFNLATLWVWPCYPYAFTTLSVLLIAAKLEGATALSFRITWGVLLALLVAISLLFASVAIGLLGAIVLSITSAILFRNRRLALVRLKIYVPVLLLGVVVQGLWMHHERVPASAGIPATEWPLPGFPQPYLAQLRVKNGNDPELGFATPGDIALRVAENAHDEFAMLSRTILGRLHSIKPAEIAAVSSPGVQLDWTSIFVFGSVLLVALGWCDRIRRTEGSLQEWYFAGYEFIFLLWPWNWEPRFLLPIAPLACVYLWHGGKTIVDLAKNWPRVIGIAWLPVSIILTVGAGLSLHPPPIGSHSQYLELQDELSFVVWLFSAVLAAWMIWANAGWLKPVSAASTFWRTLTSAPRLSLQRLFQLVVTSVVICLILCGLRLQLQAGLANLDTNPVLTSSADAEAGAWVRSHTEVDAVVMARQVPSIYHYSKRKVIWFPPSSNPQLLMNGIVEHKVNVVVVVQRESPYYFPPEDVCFAALLKTYPDAFRLIYDASQFKIFGVTTNSLLGSRFTQTQRSLTAEETHAPNQVRQN